MSDLDDATVIARFVSEAQQMLDDSHLTREGLAATFKVSFDERTGFTFEGSSHDREHVQSYLISLRRFLLSDDVVYVGRVKNIVRSHIRDPEARKRLDDSHRWWARHKWVKPFKIVVQETDSSGSVVSETTMDQLQVFDAFLYGKAAHVKEPQARMLDQLRELWPQPLVQYLLLDTAVEHSRYIGYVLGTILEAKKRGEWSDEPLPVAGNGPRHTPPDRV